MTLISESVNSSFLSTQYPPLVIPELAHNYGHSQVFAIFNESFTSHGYPLRYDFQRHRITVLNSSELTGRDFFSLLNSDKIKSSLRGGATSPSVSIKTVGRNDDRNLECLFTVKFWHCELGSLSCSLLDETTYVQTVSGLLLIQ